MPVLDEVQFHRIALPASLDFAGTRPGVDHIPDEAGSFYLEASVDPVFVSGRVIGYFPCAVVREMDEPYGTVRIGQLPTPDRSELICRLRRVVLLSWRSLSLVLVKVDAC